MHGCREENRRRCLPFDEAFDFVREPSAPGPPLAFAFASSAPAPGPALAADRVALLDFAVRSESVSSAPPERAVGRLVVVLALLLRSSLRNFSRLALASKGLAVQKQVRLP